MLLKTFTRQICISSKTAEGKKTTPPPHLATGKRMPSASVFSLAPVLLCELPQREPWGTEVQEEIWSQVPPCCSQIPSCPQQDPTPHDTEQTPYSRGLASHLGTAEAQTQPFQHHPTWTFSLGLAVTVTILTQHQAPPSEISCTYTLECVGDLPAPAICHTPLL